MSSRSVISRIGSLEKSSDDGHSYIKKMKALKGMFEDANEKYNDDSLYFFAEELDTEDYNFFLLHAPINKKLPESLSRDEAASRALGFIIEYMLKLDNTSDVAKEMANAIDEFVHLDKNELSYDDLLVQMGKDYRSNGVLELMWKPTPVHESYYPSGNLKERYYVNELGEKDGPCTTWYDSGDVKREVTYENGEKNGVEQIWHENGNQAEELYYVDGVQDGEHIIWYKNGNPSEEIHYDNGVVNGLYRSWYLNGSPKEESMYEDDEHKGSYMNWDKNGVISEGEY